jgi:hypothetical protein
VNAQFEQYEREVERGLADLATRLDQPAPNAEQIAALKRVVVAEARRLGRRQRRITRLRPWLGAAAAVLLTVGLSLPFGSTPREVVVATDHLDVVFSDWLDALDESGQQFTSLLGDDWLLETRGSGADEDGSLGDPLGSLEESLESFERIIGA